jgi:hypothetical protein
LKEFFADREKESEAKRAEAIKKLSPDDLDYCRRYKIDPAEYKSRNH